MVMDEKKLNELRERLLGRQQSEASDDPQRPPPRPPSDPPSGQRSSGESSVASAVDSVGSLEGSDVSPPSDTASRTYRSPDRRGEPIPPRRTASSGSRSREDDRPRGPRGRAGGPPRTGSGAELSSGRRASAGSGSLSYQRAGRGAVHQRQLSDAAHQLREDGPRRDRDLRLEHQLSPSSGGRSRSAPRSPGSAPRSPQASRSLQATLAASAELGQPAQRAEAARSSSSTAEDGRTGALSNGRADHGGPRSSDQTSDSRGREGWETRGADRLRGSDGEVRVEMEEWGRGGFGQREKRGESPTAGRAEGDMRRYQSPDFSRPRNQEDDHGHSGGPGGRGGTMGMLMPATALPITSTAKPRFISDSEGEGRGAWRERNLSRPRQQASSSKERLPFAGRDLARDQSKVGSFNNFGVF